MRSALGTLPWVEQASIETDIPGRLVRFNLTEKGAFRAEEVQQALKARGFPVMTVKSVP